MIKKLIKMIFKIVRPIYLLIRATFANMYQFSSVDSKRLHKRAFDYVHDIQSSLTDLWDKSGHVPFFGTSMKYCCNL